MKQVRLITKRRIKSVKQRIPSLIVCYFTNVVKAKRYEIKRKQYMLPVSLILVCVAAKT